MALLLALALAAPDAAAIRAAWARDAAAIAEHGGVVTLAGGDFDVLGRGGIVARRLDTPEGAFALGAIWVDAPIAAPWIAVQDARDNPLSSSIKNDWLPGATPTRRAIHMEMLLPWPVADRQWVAEFRANRALWDATAGRVWQRAWSLRDPSEAPHPDPDAMWVDVNTGAWTLVRADGGTLVVFAVRTVLGGAIPVEISQAWAVASLRGSLRKLAEVAATEREHYGAGHEAMYTPAGERLPVGLVGLD